MHGRLSWHDTFECGVHTNTITSYYFSHIQKLFLLKFYLFYVMKFKDVCIVCTSALLCVLVPTKINKVSPCLKEQTSRSRPNSLNLTFITLFHWYSIKEYISPFQCSQKSSLIKNLSVVYLLYIRLLILWVISGSIGISPVLKFIVIDQAFNLYCDWTRAMQGLLQ